MSHTHTSLRAGGPRPEGRRSRYCLAGRNVANSVRRRLMPVPRAAPEPTGRGSGWPSVARPAPQRRLNAAHLPLEWLSRPLADHSVTLPGRRADDLGIDAGRGHLAGPSVGHVLGAAAGVELDNHFVGARAREVVSGRHPGASSASLIRAAAASRGESAVMLSTSASRSSKPPAKRRSARSAGLRCSARATASHASRWLVSRLSTRRPRWVIAMIERRPSLG